MRSVVEKRGWVIVLTILSVLGEGCDKSDDCTRIDRIGGGLLPEQEIEVPCDFPEPKPLGLIPYN